MYAILLRPFTALLVAASIGFAVDPGLGKDVVVNYNQAEYFFSSFEDNPDEFIYRPNKHTRIPNVPRYNNLNVFGYKNMFVHEGKLIRGGTLEKRFFNNGLSIGGALVPYAKTLVKQMQKNVIQFYLKDYLDIQELKIQISGDSQVVTGVSGTTITTTLAKNLTASSRIYGVFNGVPKTLEIRRPFNNGDTLVPIYTFPRDINLPASVLSNKLFTEIQAGSGQNSNSGKSLYIYVAATK